MGQFFLCSTFHKRSSGKLIRERATANLDRALREQIHIYLFFIFKQTRPTTRDPRLAHTQPTRPRHLASHTTTINIAKKTSI